MPPYTLKEIQTELRRRKGVYSLPDIEEELRRREPPETPSPLTAETILQKLKTEVKGITPALKKAAPWIPLVGRKYEKAITYPRKKVFGVEEFRPAAKEYLPDWLVGGMMPTDLAAEVIPKLLGKVGAPIKRLRAAELGFRKQIIGHLANIYTRPDVLALHLFPTVAKVAMTRRITNWEHQLLQRAAEPVRRRMRLAGIKPENLFTEGTVLQTPAIGQYGVPYTHKVFLNDNLSRILKGMKIRVPRGTKFKAPLAREVARAMENAMVKSQAVSPGAKVSPLVKAIVPKTAPPVFEKPVILVRWKETTRAIEGMPEEEIMQVPIRPETRLLGVQPDTGEEIAETIADMKMAVMHPNLIRKIGAEQGWPEEKIERMVKQAKREYGLPSRKKQERIRKAAKRVPIEIPPETRRLVPEETTITEIINKPTLIKLIKESKKKKPPMEEMRADDFKKLSGARKAFELTRKDISDIEAVGMSEEDALKLMEEGLSPLQAMERLKETKAWGKVLYPKETPAPKLVDPASPIDATIQQNAREASENIRRQREKGGMSLKKEDVIEIADADLREALYAGRQKTLPVIDSVIRAVTGAKRQIQKLQFEPTLKGYPRFVNDIRTGLVPTIRRSVRKAQLSIGGILGDLTKIEENLVLDVGFLRDFLATAQRGLALPRGVSAERVTAELERLEPLSSPKVKERVEKLRNLLELVRQDLVARGVLEANQSMKDYLPHFVMEYAPTWFNRVFGFIPKRLKKPYRAYTKKRAGTEKDIIASKDAITHYLTSVYLDNMVDDWAVGMLEKYSIPTPKGLKVLPNHHYEIQGKDYQGFQYVPGRVLYPTLTANPQLIEKAILEGWSVEEWLASTGPRGGQPLRKGVALGRYQKTYLIEKPLADRLLKLRQPAGDIPFLYELNRATQFWKRFTLDMAGLPFHIGNILGDALNMYLSSPAAFLRIPDGIELIATHVAKYTPQQKEWFDLLVEHDVLQSGFVREYMPILQRSNNPFALIERFSDYREAMLRATMGIYQIERVKAGLPPKGPHINTQGLDPTSAGLKIAREFTVDYFAIPPAYRKFLRSLATPFITFYEKNAGNWGKYVKNAPVGFFAKIAAPVIAMWVYNNTGWRRKIEENLPQFHRWRPHVILKTYDLDKDGKADKALIWSLQTPLDMAFAWAGMDRVLDKVTQVRAGRMSVRDAAIKQLIDFGLGAPRQIQRLLGPGIQMIQGLVSNRDPWTHGYAIPPELKGTGTLGEKKHVASYVLQKLILPIAQYTRTERGTDPTRGPIADWLIHGPFDVKRAFGFYTIDLTMEPNRIDIEETGKLRGKRSEYLLKAEDAVIKGQTERFREILAEGRASGYVSTADVMRRVSRPRVQIAKLRYRLRQTTDPEERRVLEVEIQKLREAQAWQRFKTVPLSIREEVYEKRRKVKP